MFTSVESCVVRAGLKLALNLLTSASRVLGLQACAIGPVLGVEPRALGMLAKHLTS